MKETTTNLIHCTTEKEAKILLNKLNKMWYVWVWWESLLFNTNWDYYGEETCYSLEDKWVMYSEKKYYKKLDSRNKYKRYKIFSLKDFLKENKAFPKSKIKLIKRPDPATVDIIKTHHTKIDEIIEAIDKFQKENHWKFAWPNYFWEFLYKDLRNKF